MSKTILFADDDADMRVAMSLRLQRLGFTIWCAQDTTQTLLGVQRALPDLVIMDLNMPGSATTDICEFLALDPEFATIPIVVYTGCSAEFTKRHVKDMGAVYIHKTPGSWEHVKSTIYELIGQNEGEAVGEVFDVLN